MGTTGHTIIPSRCRTDFNTTKPNNIWKSKLTSKTQAETQTVRRNIHKMFSRRSHEQDGETDTTARKNNSWQLKNYSKKAKRRQSLLEQ